VLLILKKYGYTFQSKNNAQNLLYDLNAKKKIDLLFKRKTIFFQVYECE